jgi:hypothetical protein
MTLSELCEPLFQHICRLNRRARKLAAEGASSDAAAALGDETQIRAELAAVLGEMKSKATASPELMAQLERVRLPLIFFCDYAILTSSLPFARDWKPMAEVDEDPPHYAWSQEFFDMLDATMKERGEGADERLLIFYECMGLGFKGMYEGDPQALRKKMKELASRLRSRLGSESESRICEDAYITDKRKLDLPPAQTLVPMAIALVVLILVLGIGIVYLFHRESKELREATGTVGQWAAEARHEGAEAGK